MAEANKIKLVENHSEQGSLKGIVDRAVSSDVVIGFVAYAGSGNGYIAKQLSTILQGDFSRKVCTIKASDLIREYVLGKGWGKAEDIPGLQDMGDRIRMHYNDPSAIAALFIKEVHAKRAEGYDTFVFDSMKRKEEIDLLRRVYSDSAIIIGVGCNPNIRARRLATKLRLDSGDEELTKIIDRDILDSNDKKNGQGVIKAFHLSDYFIDNSVSNESTRDYKLPDKIKSFANLVFSRNVQRPDRDEKGMYLANAAALRSSCLSRQVGASILSKDGMLVSVGANEVPSYGGGTYNEENDTNKNRCFHKGFCSNTKKQNEVAKEIFHIMKSSGAIISDFSEENFVDIIGNTRVGSLIEFSRAIHAEMDAIISVARKGGKIDSGSILYTTTYPCHSCARHIVSAGIERVVYLEPYQKSLALDLHGDSISEGGDTEGKVNFEPYQGVSPRLYERVYRKSTDLKDKSGKYAVSSEGKEERSLFNLNYIDLEKKICDAINASGGE